MPERRRKVPAQTCPGPFTFSGLAEPIVFAMNLGVLELYRRNHDCIIRNFRPANLSGSGATSDDRRWVEFSDFPDQAGNMQGCRGPENQDELGGFTKGRRSQWRPSAGAIPFELFRFHDCAVAWISGLTT